MVNRSGTLAPGTWDRGIRLGQWMRDRDLTAGRILSSGEHGEVKAPKNDHHQGSATGKILNQLIGRAVHTSFQNFDHLKRPLSADRGGDPLRVNVLFSFLAAEVKNFLRTFANKVCLYAQQAYCSVLLHQPKKDPRRLAPFRGQLRI